MHGGDALGCGARGRDGGNRRHTLCDRGAANGLLVKESILTARRIHDELDTLALDEIDDVRATLFPQTMTPATVFISNR